MCILVSQQTSIQGHQTRTDVGDTFTTLITYCMAFPVYSKYTSH